jgi:hypothetical protein
VEPTVSVVDVRVQLSPTSVRPLSPEELETIAKPFRDGSERDSTVKGIRLKRGRDE